MAKKRNPADLTKRNEEAVKKTIRRLEQRVVLLTGDVVKLRRAKAATAQPEPYLTIAHTKSASYNGLGANGGGSSISLSGREALVLKLYEEWKKS